MTRFFAIFILLSFVWMAYAQPPVLVEAPQPRFALPGEYVTLVFRLGSSSVQSVDLSATSAQAWEILRQPGEVVLEPGKARPVAVTVGVPAEAAAFTEDVITLELSTGQETLSASVELTVAELRGLDLEVPAEVVLGDDGFGVTVKNRGNVAESVMVSLVSAGQVLDSAELELAPQTQSEARLNAAEAGFFTLVLSRADEQVLTRSVRLIKYGVPPPSPFVLGGQAQLSLNTRTGWEGILELDGPLSDYTTLEARLDATTWRASFLELDTETWRARLGAGRSDPFRLSLPADFGLSGEYTSGAWGTAGALGLGSDGTLHGFMAGAFQQKEGEVAAGFGTRGGTWLTRSRANWTFEDVSSGALTLETVDVEADLSYSDTGLSALAKATIKEEAARLGFGIRANQLFSNEARLSLNGSLAASGGTVSVSGSVPLAPEAEADFNFGLSAPMPSELPGTLSLNTKFGLNTSFANLSYLNEFPWGWRTNSHVGMINDDDGAALDIKSNWSLVGPTYLSLDSDLTWYPGQATLGGLRFRYQSPVMRDAFTVFSSGGWDIGARSVGLGLGALWQDDRWQLDLSADANYSYRLVEPWSASLDLSASYAFELGVPETLTEVAGGRRRGVVRGTVRANDTLLAGVEVQVGRYRLLTDEQGQYRAALTPGSYDVRIELASLPITYRLETSERVRVEVEAKEDVVQDFLVIETAALEGRVLQDTDADGNPDTPLQGLSATLGIIDAEGLQRAVATDETGFFRVQGILPGATEVRLLSGPLGSTPVGDAVQTVTLTAGEIGTVQLLLQPASARAQSFGGAALRVRRVSIEAERVPPGTAPLVSVEVQGEADSVTLVSPLGDVALSLENNLWQGRLTIPDNAPEGPLAFEIIATQGETEKSRRGQVIVSGDAAAFLVNIDGPVNAGEALSVTVTTFFAAQSVTVDHPFGESVSLEAGANRGQWTGELAVPATTADDIYELNFLIVKEDGSRLAQLERVRVTEP